MISVIEYDNTLLSNLIFYCKSEVTGKDIAKENMWCHDWESAPHTLLYILENTDRFSNSKGKFHLLYEHDKIIGCAGVYLSDFSSKVCIAGVRSWLSRPYRKQQLVRNYLLPVHKAWAIEQNADIVALSFNSYNKNLIKMFSRGQRLYHRSPENIFYSNFNYIDFPVLIQGTPQWVIYEKLNGKDIDWESLKYTG